MNRRCNGFTLLEVLIALVVLALSLGAVIQAASRFTVNQSYLRDRTLAEWVARNRLAELMLSGEWPATGRKKGEVKMPLGDADEGGRNWRWEINVSETPEEDLRRVVIDIYREGDDDGADPQASLTGFIARPS